MAVENVFAQIVDRCERPFAVKPAVGQQAERKKYGHARPFTKESLLYRELFEKYYPGQSRMVADFWMPNRDWEGCDVDDPSARVLANYGDSGV